MRTPEEKRLLLDFARYAVILAAMGEAPPVVPEGEVFRERGGAFVTLKAEGRLRGCIGSFSGTGTLGDTIRDMARQAALGDPRFPVVKPEEVGSLSIELSLLSPMKPVRADEVEPGVHGLYVRRGSRAGTLLPQVAREEGWNRDAFLAHTCMKAGLPPDAWKDMKTEIFAYTAEVFGEKEETDQ
jgi:AmmeMemoRadiSam system protein A